MIHDSPPASLPSAGIIGTHRQKAMNHGSPPASLPSVGIIGTHHHAQLEVNFAEDCLESACDSACFTGKETS